MTNATTTQIEHEEARLRRFVGWLTTDIPELSDVDIPRLAESLDRFLAVDGGCDTSSEAAEPSKP